MTTTLLVAILGAGFGYGLYRALRALQPRAVPLPIALEDLQPAPPLSRRTRRRQRTARPEAPSWPPGRNASACPCSKPPAWSTWGVLERKLRIIGRPIEVHATHKILGALLRAHARDHGGGRAAARGSSGLAGDRRRRCRWCWRSVGWVYPDLPLNDEVEERQASFRHALSSYIDLVVIADLAGGIGLETALNSAAEVGDGWAYAEIRDALTRARLTGRPVWERVRRTRQPVRHRGTAGGGVSPRTRRRPGRPDPPVAGHQSRVAPHRAAGVHSRQSPSRPPPRCSSRRCCS